MTWQIIVAFIVGAIVGGTITGIVAYKKGRKDEYARYRYFRMRIP